MALVRGRLADHSHAVHGWVNEIRIDRARRATLPLHFETVGRSRGSRTGYAASPQARLELALAMPARGHVAHDRDDDPVERLVQHLGGGVAEDPFGAGVPEPDAAFAVGG